MSGVKYAKFTHLEHILARPDSYVGSLNKDTSVQWTVVDSEMKETKVIHNAGLFKIFDEILVNAVDQCADDGNMVNKITVSVDEHTISIMNSGIGVSIEKHPEYGEQWIPEMIFGELLTSSNYDDKDQRTTGGRNGYGAKLANVFSKEFTIDVASCVSQQRYIQTWTHNMTVKSVPKITKYSKKLGYTKITFRPDLSRFNMTTLNDTDIIKLFERRTYDICACTPLHVKVFFNEVQLTCNTFEKYVDMFIGDKKKTERVLIKTPRWEVCIASSNSGFKQVSFVNGINTSTGGSHVDSVTSNLVRKTTEYITNKHKDVKIKPAHIKENIFVFVKCVLVNPTFSSQTKTECTSRYKDFGSSFDFTDDIMKKIVKLPFIQEAIAIAKHKEMRELKKTDGRKTSVVRGIAKLEDANKAGTSRSNECTLILTEGDSAKTFAISGLGVVGRDLYGVFPLKGKLLNVRDATAKQLAGNEEINSIKKILGLQNDKVYQSTNELRYGKVMILTDADVDGSHIKGLFMNFIHHFWPSLVRHPFLTSLRTPILKATKRGASVSFYTKQDYDVWKETNHSGWGIKYYKGLGTSTSIEARSYFTDLKRNTIQYTHNTAEDDHSMLLAFKKTMADDRKHWIKEGTMGKQTLDHTKPQVTIKDFINHDLRWFSIADNERSIPSMIDGLKPSQRKVLFGCRKRSSNSEIKVSQLAGVVSVETCYHHGEQSMMATIVGMAQDHVGSNNINLLEPKGQFGTRLMGGKDAASPRYIFTQLSPVVDALFRPEDDQILTYVEDEGVSVEPVYYFPTLPLVLINGSEGIGTGYSTSIPCYNPKDVKTNVTHMLNGKPLVEMVPWYKNFGGTIESIDCVRFITRGVWSIQGDLLTITELPIGRWTSDYKEFLEQLLDENKITGYQNHSTETKVNFTIRIAQPTDDICKQFKLATTISTSNMHCFDENGIIHKYESPSEIIKAFVEIKLKAYELRKTAMLGNLHSTLASQQHKLKFMRLVMLNEIRIFREPRQSIDAQLQKQEFPKSVHESLLHIKLDSFTEENLTILESRITCVLQDIEKLQASSVNQLWAIDLNKICV